MRLNLTTRIVGDRIVLVPYKEHHVEKYHEWMSRREIQDLTASEPLSLDEEFQMQRNWQIDEDKLTFIILRKELLNSLKNGDEEENKKREIESMIGDVNLFLQSSNEENDAKNQGELEVMIVDDENRGRGFGSEAVSLMMQYSVKYIKSLERFVVKIGEENEASIRMFKKLGFTQYEHIKVFKQIGLDLKIDENEQLKKKFELNIDFNYN